MLLLDFALVLLAAFLSFSIFLALLERTRLEWVCNSLHSKWMWAKLELVCNLLKPRWINQNDDWELIWWIFGLGPLILFTADQTCLLLAARPWCPGFLGVFFLTIAAIYRLLWTATFLLVFCRIVLDPMYNRTMGTNIRVCCFSLWSIHCARFLLVLLSLSGGKGVLNAAWFGSPRLVHYSLALGDHVDSASWWSGKTPLMMAASTHGDQDTILTLLKAHASVCAVSKTNQTARDYARAHNHSQAVELLQAFGTDCAATGGEASANAQLIAAEFAVNKTLEDLELTRNAFSATVQDYISKLQALHTKLAGEQARALEARQTFVAAKEAVVAAERTSVAEAERVLKGKESAQKEKQHVYDVAKRAAKVAAAGEYPDPATVAAEADGAAKARTALESAKQDTLAADNGVENAKDRFDLADNSLSTSNGQLSSASAVFATQRAGCVDATTQMVKGVCGKGNELITDIAVTPEANYKDIAEEEEGTLKDEL